MFQGKKHRLVDHQTRQYRELVHVFLVAIVFLSVLMLSACGGLVSHKVERGESLYSIGFYYGHDYRDIAEWNNIQSPYLINEGQWLRVAPPDNSNQWWDEEKQIPSNQRFSKKHSQQQHKTQARQTPRRTTPRQTQNNSDNTRTERRVRKSPNKIIVEDFTDKSGKISNWVWPTKGRLLNPDKKFSQRNKGIDIAGRRGQLVVATAAGKIVYSGSGLIGYGQLIIIKHNKTYLSAYAHNEKILVKEGDIVKRGQNIAHMGRTPDNHIQLHFEIRRNGKPVDPLRFLKQ